MRKGKNYVAHIFCALFITFFLSSCISEKDAYDPLSYTPKTINSCWCPYSHNVVITSKQVPALLPKDFDSNKELSLAELIDIALINNPNTKISWQQARYAAAEYGQAASKLYPSLDFDSSYQRERESDFTEHLPNHIKRTTYYRTTITPDLNLSYTIFDFCQKRSTSDQARYALFYANRMHNQSIETQVKLVMEDYYNYQYQRQKFISLESDLENAMMSLDAADKKFITGVAAIGDINQAKSKYLQTKIDLINQGQEVENSYATLANDLGLPSNLKFRVVTYPEDITITEMLQNVDTLIQKSFTNRQDLLADLDSVKSNEYYLSYAKVAGYPTVNGTLNVGKNFFNNNLEDDYHYTLTFNLNFPLFRGFFFKNEILKAKSNLEKAKATLLQKKLEITKEVAITYSSVKTSASTYKNSKEYLTTATEQFKIALASYKAGVNTILDVLSAQTYLADARSKSADATKDWYTSLSDLAYVTGTLCKGPEGQKNEKK
jgi:outer membrane protein